MRVRVIGRGVIGSLPYHDALGSVIGRDLAATDLVGELEAESLLRLARCAVLPPRLGSHLLSTIQSPGGIMHRFSRIALPVCILAAFSCKPAEQPAPIKQPIPTGPVAFVGHGTAFDSTGKEIPQTPVALVMTQKYYTGEVLKRATPEQRGQHEALRSRLVNGIQLDTLSALVVDAFLFDTLVRMVRPAEAERLLGLNTIIKLALMRRDSVGARFRDSLDRVLPYDVRPELRKRIVDAVWRRRARRRLSPARPEARTTAISARRTECRYRPIGARQRGSRAARS